MGDGEEDVSSGLTLFENRLGGRIAVLPHDGQSSGIEDIYFRNWTRQRELRAAIDWLSRGSIPFFVEGVADIVPIRIDQPGRTVLGIVNLSSDPITHIQGFIGDFTGRAHKISEIDKGGHVRKLEKATLKDVGKGLEIRAPLRVDSLDMGILILDK